MQVIKEGLLRIDPGLLLWTIITFAVLLLLLWKTAWKPIVEALDSRAEKIRGDIDSADRARQDAEKFLLQHKEMMDKAKDESSQVIAKGRDEAEKVKNEIIEKANVEAREITQRATKEIEFAKETALSDLKKEIVFISTDIASKIIQKNLDSKDQNSLVEETLNKLETVQ